MSAVYKVNVDLINVSGKKLWRHETFAGDTIPIKHLEFLIKEQKIILVNDVPKEYNEITVTELKIYLSNKGINYSGKSLKADLYNLYLNTFK
jgi:hypothetical protein